MIRAGNVAHFPYLCISDTHDDGKQAGTLMHAVAVAQIVSEAVSTQQQITRSLSAKSQTCVLEKQRSR